jgi:hypothetical protein
LNPVPLNVTSVPDGPLVGTKVSAGASNVVAGPGLATGTVAALPAEGAADAGIVTKPTTPRVDATMIPTITIAHQTVVRGL